MCSKNVKSKFLCLVMRHTKKVRGGLELQFPEIVTSTLFGSEWPADSPAAYPWGKEPLVPTKLKVG
jgi:hypothetical protein